MSADELPDEQGWDIGWEGHRRAQRRRWARLPFSEKLRWLEETQRVIDHMTRQRERRRDPNADAP